MIFKFNELYLNFNTITKIISDKEKTLIWIIGIQDPLVFTEEMKKNFDDAVAILVADNVNCLSEKLSKLNLV